MNVEFLVTLICATLASGGLWSLILYKIQRRDSKSDNLTKLMLGLAYREIVQLCMEYTHRGSVTKDEYEDLIKYLYSPYKALGGDGTAEKMIGEVQKLPIRQEKR